MTTWTKLRTLATQAAEGRVDPVSTYAGVNDGSQFSQDGNRSSYLEISFDPLTFAGGATAVTFGVWRTSDGRVDRVASITVIVADIGSPQPVIVDFHGESIAVTVESFTGGSGQTVSGAVYARPVRP